MIFGTPLYYNCYMDNTSESEVRSLFDDEGLTARGVVIALGGNISEVEAVRIYVNSDSE